MAKIATITNVDNGDDLESTWGDQVKTDIEALFTDKTAQVTTFATNKTFDLNDGAIQRVTLTGDMAVSITNQLLNRAFMLIFLQDGTGNRSVTFFSTIKWAYGLSPSLDKSANGYSSYLFIPVAESGGNWTYLGYILGEGFS